jgi:F-type H+-transporting ATPase subunit b
MPQFDTSFLFSLVFWSVVSFGILLIILYKYGLPPILGLLEEREQRIKTDLDRAEQARREAEAKLADYELRLKQAQAEAQSILEEARLEAQRQAEESQKRSEQQAAAMIRDAQDEMAREGGRLRDALRAETVGLVMAVAEQILARRLTADDDRRLIDEALTAAQSEWSQRRP